MEDVEAVGGGTHGVLDALCVHSQPEAAGASHRGDYGGGGGGGGCGVVWCVGVGGGAL